LDKQWLLCTTESNTDELWQPHHIFYDWKKLTSSAPGPIIT